MEGEIQEDWSLIARDIYAFYPLLIKYVDLQRSQWIRQNVEDAEFLYNHVGEIFNLMNTSVVSAYFVLVCLLQLLLLFLLLSFLFTKIAAAIAVARAFY